jgi:hypothetical protein
MPRNPSHTEIRAARLIAILRCTDIMPNDGTPEAKKLFLTNARFGVSVIKEGHLYYDDPKLKRPKCYTSLTPDYSWGSSFIEVKDNISGNSWNSLNRDSLNDQIRVSLLRASISGINELSPISFSQLSDADQRIAKKSLADFHQSDPGSRLYVHWDSLVSAIKSPNDNFVETIVDIGGEQRPLKQLNVPTAQHIIRYYLLDSGIMDKWDQFAKSISESL